MKFLKFWFVPIFIVFCISVICIAVNSDIDLQTKVDTFDAEIKGLTNLQKSQMEFSTLQVTINQLGFCLQATEIENGELKSTLQRAFQEVNMLKMNVQRANMFINQLLQDNAELKKQLEKENTT